jgi:two-component system cell cycle sensor histidine kinase/response regulator CckA
LSLPAISFWRRLMLPALALTFASGRLPAIAVQAESGATGERTAPWLLLTGGAVALAAVGVALNRRRLRLVERAQAAEASALRVRASEERFRRLFDQGADPQLLSDGARIVAANPAAMALLADGHGERLLGIRTSVITTEADLVMARDDVTYETDVVTVQGTLIPAAVRRTRIPLDRGELLHFQLRDLRDTRRLEAERRELETQLLASQRLEALGTLAGGVAHDFNNLLTVIRANAEIAQIALSERDDAGVLESLNAVVHASDRARDIVKQILLFSRRSVPIQARINLAALITDAQTLLRAAIPSTVQLLVEVRSADAWITGDVTQMQQLLLNLCSNAEHAMRRTGGGMLRVAVDLVSLDEPALGAKHPQRAPGRYVRLQVRDTGCGMSDDVRQRIFEPFFTTKPIGEGTGLGLAVLHGILMSHHGSVHVESAEGSGTTFELLFDLVAPAEEGANTMLTTPLWSPAVVTPRDRQAVNADAPLVLLVDDEPGILRAAERGIVAAGMRVITASGGRDALALLERHPDVAVVITDQTMPEMTGLTLAEHVRTSRPSLPIILSTGYTGRVTAERLRDQRFDAVLDKPYTLAQLTDAIDVALRAARRRQTQRA